jgi:exodeoxyribonuclease V alpha subunit
MLVEIRSGHQFKFIITYEKKGIDNVSEIDIDNYVILNDPTVDILTHCYAITIHKSQGSEWDYVIFYLPKNDNSANFINKNLIYTAITRAKKIIWNIGDMQVLELHSTMNPGYRHDTLGQRLKLLCDK